MTSTTTQSTQAKPTYLPVRKITAGAFTGALVTLTVLILNTYNPFFKQNENKISGEISGAATTVLTFIVSYLVPPGREEMVVSENGITKSGQK
jgi:Na+/proline symporter